MSTIKVKDADGNVVYYKVIESGSLDMPFQPVVPDYRIPYAINQIFKNYGDVVSVTEKGKSIIKFGSNYNLNMNVKSTIWEVGGDEVYANSNVINELISDNSSDNQEVIIEGHTLSGNNFTFLTQSLSLNGLNTVALPTPLARVNRLYNNGSTDFSGSISINISGSTKHLLVNGGNQSLKAATTIESTSYFILTSFTFSVGRKNSAVVDFHLQFREYGKVFRTHFSTTTSDSAGTHKINFEQPYIIKPNSDIRLTAESNANTTKVQGAFHGYLAEIIT